MKKTIFLTLLLSASLYTMRLPIPDKEISQRLDIPIFPEATSAQILQYFPTILVKTIYNGFLWTFKTNKNKTNYTLSKKRFFKKRKKEPIAEISLIINTETETSLVRTEDNGRIWDVLMSIATEKTTMEQDLD